MTETTEKPTPAEISQTPLATKTNTTNTNKDTLSERPKSSKTFGYIAITISCAAIAASAWTFYQQQQQNQLLIPLAVQLQSLQQTQQQLNQAVDSQAKASALIPRLQTAIDSQTSKSQQLSNTLDAQQQAFIKQDAGLQSVNQQLSRLSNTTKEDWKLAEAEYLIRLANQRLLMESDINGAQNLLQTADQILADMADPILFDTRKAIAKDIQALKATTSFDLEGLYLQLDALNKQVESLPQTEPSSDWQNAGAQVTDEASNTTAESNIFQSTMTELWQSLRSLIVINYQHRPIKVLLPAADYQELISSLQLQINVAQLALLKKESTIYQTALSHVAEAISIHFDLESQTTIAFMTSITALQQINPSPELPLPRQSLTQMKKLMSQWNALHAEASTPLAPQSPTTNAAATENDSAPAPVQAPTEPSPTPAKPLEPSDANPASTNEDEVAA